MAALGNGVALELFRPATNRSRPVITPFGAYLTASATAIVDAPPLSSPPPPPPPPLPPREREHAEVIVTTFSLVRATGGGGGCLGAFSPDSIGSSDSLDNSLHSRRSEATAGSVNGGRSAHAHAHAQPQQRRSHVLDPKWYRQMHALSLNREGRERSRSHVMSTISSFERSISVEKEHSATSTLQRAHGRSSTSTAALDAPDSGALGDGDGAHLSLPAAATHQRSYSWSNLNSCSCVSPIAMPALLAPHAGFGVGAGCRSPPTLTLGGRSVLPGLSLSLSKEPSPPVDAAPAPACDMDERTPSATPPLTLARASASATASMNQTDAAERGNGHEPARVCTCTVCHRRPSRAPSQSRSFVRLTSVSQSQTRSNNGTQTPGDVSAKATQTHVDGDVNSNATASAKCTQTSPRAGPTAGTSTSTTTATDICGKQSASHPQPEPRPRTRAQRAQSPVPVATSSASQSSGLGSPTVRPQSVPPPLELGAGAEGEVEGAACTCADGCYLARVRTPRERQHPSARCFSLCAAPRRLASFCSLSCSMPYLSHSVAEL